MFIKTTVSALAVAAVVATTATALSITPAHANRADAILGVLADLSSASNSAAQAQATTAQANVDAWNNYYAQVAQVQKQNEANQIAWQQYYATVAANQQAEAYNASHRRY